MFIAVLRSKDYFVAEDTHGSILYKYSENYEDATRFVTEERVISALKKSGFSGHGGIKVVEVE